MIAVRPLVPVAILFALGVALGSGLADPPAWCLLAVPVLLLTFGLAVWRGLRRPAAALGALLFLGLGMLASLRVGRPSPGAGAETDAPVTLSGRVHGPVRWIAEGYRFRLQEDHPAACSRGGAVLVTVGQGRPTIGRGDAVRLRARVRPLRGPRNPGAPDWRRYWARQGVAATAYVPDGRHLVRTARGTGLLAAVDRARQRIGQALRAGEPNDARALVLALNTGERNVLPAGLRKAYTRAGMAHLLAVSGLHLAAVVGLLYALLRWLLARSTRLLDGGRVAQLAAVVAILGGWAYALLAGATPATVRAAVLATVLLGAVVVRRAPDVWSALALAALLILAVDPAALFGASFQLTFAAVIAIVALTPRLVAAVRARLSARLQTATASGPGRRALELLAVTLVALLATGPLAAAHFGQAAPVGLLGNLVAVPLAAVLVVPLALISGLVALVWPAAAAVPLALAEPSAAALNGLARWFAGLPGAGLQLGPVAAWEAGVCYLLLAGLAAWRRRLGRVLAVLAATVLAVGFAVERLAPRFSEELVVTFLDVEHGDAILVRFPGGATALVDSGPAGRPGQRDGGPDLGERVLVPALRALGVRRLDRIYLTHGHADHAGGLAAVLRHLEVDQLVHAGVEAEDAEGHGPLAAARAHGVPVRSARLGEAWSPAPRASVEVLHPAEDDDDLGENDRSLVLRLTHGDLTILLTGDIEMPAEARLLDRGGDLRARVLKLPHHGSATSSSPELLAAVQPELAVVSGGRRGPWPAAVVAARLVARGVPALSTHACGAVSVRSTGGREIDLVVASAGPSCQVPRLDTPAAAVVPSAAGGGAE